MLELLPDDMIFEILSYFKTKKQINVVCNISKRIQKCALKLHFNWKLFNHDASNLVNSGKAILERSFLFVDSNLII
jgi:hypothetical protein